MSFAGACSNRAHEAAGLHVVLTRRGNHSAFNGGHFTRSAYSHIRCLAGGGATHWRTKGAYVDRLPDATEEQATRAVDFAR